MRRFLCERLPAPEEPRRLSAAASHHLLRVAGIAPGEPVELFDGRGAACRAVLLSVSEGQAEMGFLEAVSRPERPTRWLLMGLTKGPAFDVVVRMATELGVDHVWPVLLKRSVARGDRRARWARIAASAAAQSGRDTLPDIAVPVSLEDAMAALPDGIARVVGVPGALTAAPAAGPAALLLGPEGGLTGAEVALALAAGFTPVGLGPLVLRAETAAAAGLARLMP